MEVQLMLAGVAFQTARPHTYDHLSTPQMAPEFVPQAFRSNKTFTLTDVQLYQARVRRFVEGPRGRAALLTGGLVSRIAKDMLPFRVRVDLITEGPTPDVVYRRKNCIFKRRDGQYLYDDVLTEAEKDLILGVVTVLNTKCKLSTPI